MMLMRGMADFSLLPTDAIEKIEVMRGPASALYGSNAMAGVINITTKNGLTTPQTSIHTSGGNHDTYHAKIAHGVEKGSFGLFSHRKSCEHGWLHEQYRWKRP